MYLSLVRDRGRVRAELSVSRHPPRDAVGRAGLRAQWAHKLRPHGSLPLGPARVSWKGRSRSAASGTCVFPLKAESREGPPRSLENGVTRVADGAARHQTWPFKAVCPADKAADRHAQPPSRTDIPAMECLRAHSSSGNLKGVSREPQCQGLSCSTGTNA